MGGIAAKSEKHMKTRHAFIFIAALIFGASSSASAKVGRVWNELAPGPRVVGYDANKDEIIHQDSIVSIVPRHRPGGEHAYSGNRLEAFQFHGKRGRGGLYDALEDYKVKFDARKYQYRHR